MSADQELILSTFQSLDAEMGERWLTRTYAIFAERCPEGAALWESPDASGKGKMFNAILLSVMDGVTQPETQRRNLASDVREHQEYGVQSAMYGAFLRAMLDALKETGGAEVSEDVFIAWERQLKAIESQATALAAGNDANAPGGE